MSVYIRIHIRGRLARARRIENSQLSRERDRENLSGSSDARGAILARAPISFSSSPALLALLLSLSPSHSARCSRARALSLLIHTYVCIDIHHTPERRPAVRELALSRNHPRARPSAHFPSFSLSLTLSLSIHIHTYTMDS